MVGEFKMQSQKDYERYMNQLYGGKPPGNDYYRGLGRQKRQREEAEKARLKRQREREKRAETKPMDDLLAELSDIDTKKTSSQPKKQEKEDDEGFFGTIAGMGSAALDNATSTAGAAWDLINPFDDKDAKDAVTGMAKDRAETRQTNQKGLEDLQNLGHSTLSGATFGLAGNEDLQKGGAIGTAGQLIGSLAPGGLIGAGLRGTRLGANLTKNMTAGQRAAQRAKEGMAAGGIYGVADAGINEAVNPEKRDLADHLGNIGMETAFGGVVDPALGGLMDMLPSARRAAQQGNAPAEQTDRSYNPDDLANSFNSLSQATSNTTTGRMDNLDDILSLNNNQRQLDNLDQEINARNQDFENDLETQAGDLEAQRQELENSYEEMRQAFVDEGRQPYSNEKAIADATQEWNTTKELRKEYDRVRKNTEKFFIPKAYKEEYAGIVPKSFLTSQENAGSFDIFNAAEASGLKGIDGTHEGALKFANYLRRLQQSKTTKKKDLVPKTETPETELKQIDEINAQAFDETEDAQGMQQVLDAFDEEIAKVRNQAFADTDEFQSVENFRNTLEQDVSQRQQRVRGGQDDVLRDLGIAPETPTNVSTYDQGQGGVDANTNLNKRERAVMRTTDDLQALKTTTQLVNQHDNKLYEDFRRIRGAGGAAEQYTNETLTPAIAQIKKAGKLDDAMKYINERQLLRIKENNPDYKIPGGSNKAQLQLDVNRLGKDQDITQFAKQIQTYQRGILDMLEDAGVVSRKTKEALIANYPDYIPMFRNMKKIDKKNKDNALDEVFDQFDKLQSGNVRKAIHELSEHGSELQTNRPIDNLVQYGLNSFHAAFSNRAMQNLKKLDGTKIKNKTVAKKITPGNKNKYDKRNLVKFFDNGESVQYYVNDDLKRALDNSKGIMQIDEVLNGFQAIARIQRQSITANPLFTIRQLSRDIPQSWVVGNFSLVRDLVPAFLNSVTGGKLANKNNAYENFYKHGAGMSNMVSFDRSQFTALQKASNQLKNTGIIETTKDNTKDTVKGLFDMVRRFNEGLENAPKMAQFRKTARKTGDLDQAAYDARDIMDFSRSGEITRNINRYSAFINATVQGRSKQYRAFKDNFTSTALKTAAAGLIPSVLAYQATQAGSENQKNIINEAPEWLRQTYWLAPSPFNDEDVVKIPKPYEVALMSSTPLEFMLNNQDKVGTDGADAAKEWFNQAIWVDPSLNPFTPAYEIMTGQDTFTGGSIIPQAEQGLPAGEQGDVSTSSLARGMTAVTGDTVSPRIMDHLIGGYAPVTGEAATDWMDRALEGLGIRENEKPAGAVDTPLLSDFLIRGDNYQANTLIGDAHESTAQMQQDKSQTLQDGDPYEFYNAYRANRTVSDQDSEFAKQIRLIDNDPSLGREEKARLREQVLQKRNANVRNANDLGLMEVEGKENLQQLENQYADLGAGQTQREVEKQLTARLVQAGVPEYAVTRLMEQDLSEEQMANALRQLMRNYQ